MVVGLYVVVDVVVVGVVDVVVDSGLRWQPEMSVAKGPTLHCLILLVSSAMSSTRSETNEACRSVSGVKKNYNSFILLNINSITLNKYNHLHKCGNDVTPMLRRPR